jgi:hypothetical protein
MPVTRNFLPGAGGLLALMLLAAGCTAPAPQPCQRYDALSLSRENDFSARFDWKDSRTIDLPLERVEVAISAVRPMKGPVELVHMVGDTVADHWTLAIPDRGVATVSICAVSPPGGPSSCGASLRNLPLSPGGFYYLRAGDNTVLEAGLAFYICD